MGTDKQGKTINLDELAKKNTRQPACPKIQVTTKEATKATTNANHTTNHLLSQIACHQGNNARRDPEAVRLRDMGLAWLLKKEAGQVNRDAIDRNINSSETTEVSNIIAYSSCNDQAKTQEHDKTRYRDQAPDIITYSSSKGKFSHPRSGPAGRVYTIDQALEFIDKYTPGRNRS